MRRVLLPLLVLAACAPDPEPQPEPLPEPVPEVAAPALPERQLACLARAAYHEARGEGRDGMAAVVHVVLNRAEADRYPDEPCAVVEQGRGGRCQFSWFCDGRPDEPSDPRLYARAVEVARAAAEGELADPTDGATMFHARRVTPYWTRVAEPTATIGGHVFYRLEE